MSTTLTIALLQLAPEPTPSAALESGLAACREAASLGADIALFPEMWSIGYAHCPADPSARQQWLDAAIPHDAPWLAAFANAARDLQLAIAVTYLERTPAGPRNTLTLFDRHGLAALTYAKVHTCSFDWEAVLVPGDSFPVATLDTAHGPVQVGAMICYDREFPESARILALEGAELILVPNACELETNRLGQFHARASENVTAFAMTNYPAPAENGNSIALDGMAWTTDGRTRDMTLARASEAPGITLAHLDLTALRAYRRRESPHPYRRPAAYALLNAERFPSG